MKWKRVWMTLLFQSWLFIMVFSASAQNRYIEISADNVNIRSLPSERASIVAKSHKGDIFTLVEEQGGWYRIKMFTKVDRYVFKSLANVTVTWEPSPMDETTIREVYHETIDAERRALDEAVQMRVDDILKNIEQDRLLNDRYKLQVFHKYGLHSPAYKMILKESAKMLSE